MGYLYEDGHITTIAKEVNGKPVVDVAFASTPAMTISGTPTVNFSSTATSFVTSPKDAQAVTPSDTANLTKANAVGFYVGVSGNVKVKTSTGTDTTFVGLSSGVIYPIAIQRVFATGTTATNIVAIYNS